MPVFPCEIWWWVGAGCLGSCRQGRAVVVVAVASPACPWLPHLCPCLAYVWLQWDCMTCPGGAAGPHCTAGQHAMVLPCPRDWSRSVLPVVLFQVLAPNGKSCGHEVLNDIQLCRPDPITLHHLLTQSPKGSCLRPMCLTQWQPLPYLEKGQKQILVQCLAPGPCLLVTLQQDFCWGRYVLAELTAFQELWKAAGASHKDGWSLLTLHLNWWFRGKAW